MCSRPLSVLLSKPGDSPSNIHELYLCKPLLGFGEDIACTIEGLTVKEGWITIRLLPLSVSLLNAEVLKVLVYVIGVDPLIQELCPRLHTCPVLLYGWQLIVTVMIGVVLRVLRVRATLHSPPTQVTLLHWWSLALPTLHNRWKWLIYNIIR